MVWTAELLCVFDPKVVHVLPLWASPHYKFVSLSIRDVYLLSPFCVQTGSWHRDMSVSKTDLTPGPCSQGAYTAVGGGSQQIVLPHLSFPSTF